MKTCTRCKQTKLLSKFPKKKNKPRNHCKECQSEYQKNWYQKNKTKHKKNVARIKLAHSIKLKQIISEHLTNNPCIICGEADIVVLEFDHIDPSEKTANVCDLVKGCYAVKRVIEEIDKCRVLCANCHRRETSKQQGWYKGSKH